MTAREAEAWRVYYELRAIVKLDAARARYKKDPVHRQAAIDRAKKRLATKYKSPAFVAERSRRRREQYAEQRGLR